MGRDVHIWNNKRVYKFSKALTTVWQRSSGDRSMTVFCCNDQLHNFKNKEDAIIEPGILIAAFNVAANSIHCTLEECEHSARGTVQYVVGVCAAEVAGLIRLTNRSGALVNIEPPSASQLARYEHTLPLQSSQGVCAPPAPPLPDCSRPVDDAANDALDNNYQDEDSAYTTDVQSHSPNSQTFMTFTNGRHDCYAIVAVQLLLSLPQAFWALIGNVHGGPAEPLVRMLSGWHVSETRRQAFRLLSHCLRPILDEIFSFQVMSTRKCKACNRSSVDIEPVTSTYNLPLPYTTAMDGFTTGMNDCISRSLSVPTKLHSLGGGIPAVAWCSNCLNVTNHYQTTKLALQENTQYMNVTIMPFINKAHLVPIRRDITIDNLDSNNVIFKTINGVDSRWRVLNVIMHNGQSLSSGHFWCWRRTDPADAASHYFTCVDDHKVGETISANTYDDFCLRSAVPFVFTLSRY